MSDSLIQIAGHSPIDLLVYPLPNPDLIYQNQPKFGVCRCYGGAALIADLLHTSARETHVHGPALEGPKDGSLEQSATAITQLEAFGEEHASTNDGLFDGAFSNFSSLN